MPRRRNEDDDRGPDTPHLSGSYSIFATAARERAKTLGRVALLLSKRIDLRDPERIEMVEELAERLREIAEKFDAWPTLSAEQLEWERQHRVKELKRALTTAAEILEEVPTSGTLGKVQFPK